jgi:hypothetical protein
MNTNECLDVIKGGELPDQVLYCQFIKKDFALRSWLIGLSWFYIGTSISKLQMDIELKQIRVLI